MKKTLTVGSLSLAAAVLLVGCGSSSSTEDTSTETLTGYFIDAAVANVDYKTTSGLDGRTDTYGRFEYKYGDKVELSIGNLSLGETEPSEDGLVTPATLTEGDQTQETLLLRTLQALDVDGNLSNGIVIPEEVISDLEDINETSLADQNESSLIEIIDKGDKHILDSDYDGVIDVSESDAKDHFENSQAEWDEGKRPDEGHEEEPVGEFTFDNNTTHGYGPRYGEDNATEGSEGSEGGDFNLSAYPVSVLTQDLKDALAHMGNEERLAYDVYHNLYEYHVTENATEVKQLSNISEKSEVLHVGIVQDIVTRYALTADDLTDVNATLANNVPFEEMQSGVYDIQAIQELYDTLLAKGETNTTEALMVGCMVEVTDVNDLDTYITMAEDANATDLVAGFNVLRDGSYSHYWAFDKGLKNAGIDNGCYVEGDTLLGENKDGIYPVTEHGSDNE
jgi:hypothetical protein